MINDLPKNTSWLVVRNENSTSYRQIDPLFIELDAALYFLKEGMIKTMLDKSSLRPRSQKMTRKEQKAWKAYNEIMGKDSPTFFAYPSMNDIAESGCKFIKDILIKNEMNIEKISKTHCKKTKKQKREKNNPISDLEV